MPRPEVLMAVIQYLEGLFDAEWYSKKLQSKRTNLAF
jgi:hypothetical protein